MLCVLCYGFLIETGGLVGFRFVPLNLVCFVLNVWLFALCCCAVVVR